MFAFPLPARPRTWPRRYDVWRPGSGEGGNSGIITNITDGGIVRAGLAYLGDAQSKIHEQPVNVSAAFNQAIGGVLAANEKASATSADTNIRYGIAAVAVVLLVLFWRKN